MKINWPQIFGIFVIILIVISFVLLYMLGTRFQSAGSAMDDLFDTGTAIYHGKMVPVIVINISQDGAVDTEAALLRGDLYLLMENVDDKTKIFFNDVNSLQQLDEYQQGMLSSNNAVYSKLEIGQFVHGGKDFNEVSLADAGVRAIEIYPAPKQLDKYGQVVGDVVMANGNHYPLQLIQVESKNLGL